MHDQNPEDIAALVSSWNLATSPRVNGGWIAKGWRNGHCYSESRDTLAEAVTGLVAQLKAATKAPTFDDSVKKLADTWGKPSLSALDAEVERLCEAIDHTQLGPKAKPPEGTFAKTVIARQVQAVLGLRKPTEAELTSALYEALDGYEMSLVLVKMLRAQSKKVRAEGADPIITLAKIDALEDVIDLLLKA